MVKDISIWTQIPIKDHPPAFKAKGLAGSRYPLEGRNPSKKIFYMRAITETDGLYGATGKRLGHQESSHVINITV